MAHSNKPAALGRDGLGGNCSSLGSKIITNFTPTTQRQSEARQYEAEAQYAARAALQLGGGMSLQQVALSRFYASRCIALMIGGRR